MKTSRSGRIDRRRLVTSSVIGGAAILSKSSLVTAAPTNDQPMLMKTQTGSGPDASNGVEAIWTFETGDEIDSPPAVADGVVYCGYSHGDSYSGHKGSVYALVAEDGTKRWQFEIDGYTSSTPVVVDGVVYVGSRFGADYSHPKGYLYAVNVEDGSERWRFGAGDEDFSSPTVINGVVYIWGTGGLHAVSAEDGKERWRFAGGSTSQVALQDRIVYFGGDGLYAVDAMDGTELWRFATDRGPYSSPAIVADAVYAYDLNGTLYAVNKQDGTELWRLTIGDSSGMDIRSEGLAAPLVIDGVVYGKGWGESFYVYAVEANTGMEHWRVGIGGLQTMSPGGDWWSISPVIMDGALYVVGDGLYAVNVPDGTGRFVNRAQFFYDDLGTVDGILYAYGDALYALDAKDGTELWSFATESEIETSPVVAKGMVYVGCVNGSRTKGTLYAIGRDVPKLSAGGTAHVTEKTNLRGGPAPTAVERAELKPDTVVTITGEAVTTNEVVWWPVTVDETGDQGWVEASKLEPLTSGPQPAPAP